MTGVVWPDAGLQALVVVPTYNERDNLPALLEGLLQTPSLGVLIVDDGSTDGSAERLDELAAANPALRVLHAGDAYAFTNQIPILDANNGGSGVDFPKTIEKAYAGLKNVDILINGHNPTTTTMADR